MTGQRTVSAASALWMIGFLTLALSPAYARSAASPPALPAPAGTVVNVSNDAQLQAAVQHLASNTTIVIAPGTYVLSSTLYVNGTFSNVGIRGATNNRDDVVLVGGGMGNASIPFGIWTGGNVNGILIANLTIRDVYYHPINFNAGTQGPRVYNVRLVDAGQQFIKSNPDSAGNGVNNGIVEYSVMEYTSTAPSDYTNGVDVHAGANWVIRHNLFRNLVAPGGALAGPAILVWNHASGTITEGNTFINCSRAIAYGLQDISGTDHSGGIIRNNFIYRAGNQPGDVGIGVYDSPNTQVLNNTVYLSGTYGTSIEYRFAQTTGVVIANNLVDGSIWARDGASASLNHNVTGASASLFINPASGDLHLASNASVAIDQGVALAAVTDDWDGDSRPQGSGYDVGADERSNGTPAPAPAPAPAPSNGTGFDKDGRTDLAVWRPTNGTWYVRSSSSSYSMGSASTYQWGLPGDLSLACDFDGDGAQDLVVWRPSNGTWYIRTSSSGYSVAGALVYQWGLPGDTPVEADFDGDGKTDLAVWRPANGTWYIRTSSSGFSLSSYATYQWGLPGDVPLVTDFDGDGKSDLAVWRPSDGMWYIRTSSSGYSLSSYRSYQWGLAGDIPLSGDFDGDGRTELTVWRPSNGTWYFRTSSSGFSAVGWSSYQWGLPGDTPVIADFDGDKRSDLTVWRPSNGTWYVLTSSSGYAVGAYGAYQWGLLGDAPVR